MDGKVLMGKRSETPFLGTWSVPGGCREVVDLDELSTAIREFEEETSIDFQSLGTSFICRWTLRVPFFSWSTYFFRIEKLDCNPVPHEFYELQWLDPMEILENTDEKKHFRPFSKSEVRCLLRNL